MRKRIAIELQSTPSIEVDGAMVAQGLGLEVDTFRRLMDERKITLLCERGVGEDEGLHRATFYHGKRRLRLVLDRFGKVVANAGPDAVVVDPMI